MVVVSVLMPVYNAELYLRDAVDSVLTQTFVDFELIAVDDGSTDLSLAILREYERGDCRVRVISRPNTGIVGALNDGLTVCRGEFIARMDADDMCEPERFERQVAEFRRRPLLVLLGTAALCVDPSLMPVRVVCNTGGHRELTERLLDGDGFALLHPTIMVRAQKLHEVGLYNPRYPISEDLDLYLRLSEAGEVDCIPIVLLKYRMHGNSITNRPNRAVEFARQAADEARHRRGLLRKEWPIGGVSGEGSIATALIPRNRHVEWAWSAWVSGYAKTARTYARQAWRCRPWEVHNWKLLLVTHLKRPPKPTSVPSNLVVQNIPNRCDRVEG